MDSGSFHFLVIVNSSMWIYVYKYLFRIVLLFLLSVSQEVELFDYIFNF